MNKIYFLVAGKLGVPVTECTFIDDAHHFVGVAQSVGMQTILFKDAVMLNLDLKKWEFMCEKFALSGSVKVLYIQGSHRVCLLLTAASERLADRYSELQ